ncbi:hypothetical protein B0T13DRAFT_490234 [Neurospora crassa]|nr:hypothetical protein B0T13DRAFT_490234 [Neurospora crassa]
MAIALPHGRQLKVRPEPRDKVNSPEASSNHDTHHDLNDKTRVASTSLRSSPSSMTPSSLITAIQTLFTTMPSLPLSNPIWTLLEHVYRLPNPPPPRVRDPSRPMRIICVGFPRTGTESLAQALSHLGYSHVYHGWDIVYDPSDLCYSPGWVRLARKKFYPVPGHCQAVTDAPASVFGAELIAAYPEAKVVLNMRRDEDKWQESLVRTIIKANESWGFWIASWLNRECFWAWHVYERLLWPSLFRCVGGYGELGRVWYVEDGWKPLCQFLGKEIPDMSFPHANAAAGGWKAREEQCNKRWVERAFINLLFLTLVGAIISLETDRIADVGYLRLI